MLSQAPLPKVPKLCIMLMARLVCSYLTSVSCRRNVCCHWVHLHYSACLTHCCVICEGLVTVTTESKLQCKGSRKGKPEGLGGCITKQSTQQNKYQTILPLNAHYSTCVLDQVLCWTWETDMAKTWSPNRTWLATGVTLRDNIS